MSNCFISIILKYVYVLIPADTSKQMYVNIMKVMNN